jgi:hypothetical protein
MKNYRRRRPAQLRRLWLFSVVVLFGLALWSVAVKAWPPIIYRWQAERIAATAPAPPVRDTRDGAADFDLAIDAGGRPHLIYPGLDGELLYAWRDTAGWVIQPMLPGQNPSLALDAAGRPHATLYDPAQERVIYVRLDAGHWIVERSFAAAAPPNALALDAAGRPHIAYLAPGNNPGERNPAYARRDGDQWVEQIVTTGHEPTTVTLALDAAGAPVVAYDYYEAFVVWQILAARPDGAAGWIETPVDWWEYTGNVYFDYLPHTLQMASAPGQDPVLTYALGGQFLIKPSPMQYDVFVFRLDGDKWRWLGRSCLLCAGFGETGPASLSVAPDGPDSAWVGMNIYAHLLVGQPIPDATYNELSIRWETVDWAYGSSGLEIGADSQPRAAYFNDSGGWFATREEVLLDQSSYLPVTSRN